MTRRRQSARARARSRIPLDREPDLFAAGAAAWVVRNWPQYERSGAAAVVVSPLHLWASTFQDLPNGAMRLLVVLCELVERREAHASIANLAKAMGCSNRTARARLDKLLTAEVVLVRPWFDVTPRGYDFQLLVDEDDRTKALESGFTRQRLAHGPQKETADD